VEPDAACVGYARAVRTLLASCVIVIGASACKGDGKASGGDPRAATCARAGLDVSWWLTEGMLGPDTTGSASQYGSFWRTTQTDAQRAVDAPAKALCGRLRPASAACIGDRKLADPACENPAMEVRTIVLTGAVCADAARAALPARWVTADAGGPGKHPTDAPWAERAEAVRARLDVAAVTEACGSGISLGCLYLGVGSECAALDARLRPPPP
jgi:hypothetical protein